MKTIVVTGTSSGIGFEICTQAAKLNHKVISISRNKEPLKDISGIESYSIDITKKSSINRFINDLKNKEVEIDILINNAGYLAN